MTTQVNCRLSTWKENQKHIRHHQNRKQDQIHQIFVIRSQKEIVIN